MWLYMSEGFREACLDVEMVVQTTLVEATAHDWAFAARAAKDLDLWTSALQLLFDTNAVAEAKMEIQRTHAWSTGQVVSDQILAQSREVAKNKFPDGGPIQTALLQSFTKVEEWCMQTLKKVADQVPEIMVQHIPEGQVGVFLAALFELICTQQQGITSMVVTQAGVPVHLGINNWATTASMTQLFAQVIPGLGFLHRCTATPEQIEYTPIPPKGSMMVLTSSFPGEQVRVEGTATCPIYLGKETDSGISSVELLVNKPLLKIDLNVYSNTGYTQCRTNEGCTYVHWRILILVDVVTLLYKLELDMHGICSSLYTNATIEEKG